MRTDGRRSWHLSNILLRRECKYFCNSRWRTSNGLHLEVEKDPSMTKVFFAVPWMLSGQDTMEQKPRICLDHSGLGKSIQWTRRSLIYMKDVPFNVARDVQRLLKILTFEDSLPGGSFFFCMLEGWDFVRCLYLWFTLIVTLLVSPQKVPETARPLWD
jgi:hypothetical protein